MVARAPRVPRIAEWLRRAREVASDQEADMHHTTKGPTYRARVYATFALIALGLLVGAKGAFDALW